MSAMEFEIETCRYEKGELANKSVVKSVSQIQRLYEPKRQSPDATR